MALIGNYQQLKFFSYADILSGIYPENDTAVGEIDTNGILDNTARFPYIIYAVTSGNDGSEYAIIRQLGIKLGKFAETTPDVNVIACTVLGSEQKDLISIECVKIIAKAFAEQTQKELHIYSDEKGLAELVDQINISEFQSNSSLKYAFKAASIKCLQYQNIQQIQNSPDFYHELALNKFNEFALFRKDNYAFFDNLLKEFKRAWNSTNQTFLEVLYMFRNSTDEHQFLTICGELVAYIDLNAANKAEWNQYPDKRIIAKANVRQFDWIINLLQFRIHADFSNVAVKGGGSV